jgi:hypothetical protein
MMTLFQPICKSLSHPFYLNPNTQWQYSNTGYATISNNNRTSHRVCHMEHYLSKVII